MAPSNPIEKFVVVRSTKAPEGRIVAQVQRMAGHPTYFPDAAAAHKAAAAKGGRAAGYVVESRFVDADGRETLIRLQAVPVDGATVIGMRR